MIAQLPFAALTAILGAILCVAEPARRSENAINCSGCVGGVFSGSDSGGAGCSGAVMTITAAVSSGQCEGTVNYPSGGEECIASACHAVITRSWSGLPANSSISICHEYGGVKRCVTPSPNAGPTGSGSDTKQYDISCSAGNWLWLFESPTCGMLAQATGSCSICDKD